MNNLEHYRKELGYKIFGYSIMPDHIHLLVWFKVPEYDNHEKDEPSPFLHKIVLDRKKISREGSGLPRTITQQSNLKLSSLWQDEPAFITDMDDEGQSVRQQNILSEESSINISKILHRIKGKTATDIRKKLHINFQWQKSFYDFNIYTQKKYLEKLNYIHNNRYKDSRILHPDSYPYSSMIFLETGKGILKVDGLEP